MKLNDREWKEFFLAKLDFQNYHGKRLIKNHRIYGKTPLLTAKENNNGIADFVNNKEMKKFKNIISVDMFGNSFYHDYLCCGDDNIYFFENNNLTKYHKLFITTMINQNKRKFSYAKQFRQSNANRTILMLPIKKNQPDYLSMENYIKSIVEKKEKKYKDYIVKILKKLEYKTIKSLKDKNWKEFFVSDIFDTVQRGKRLTKTKQIKGDIPYVSSTALNNGVDNFIGNATNVRVFNGCVTIANSGSVGASFYHPYSFVASDHVTHLQQEHMSEYVYLFITTLTNRFKQKYNFNREINDKRVSKEKIILPVDEKSKPDYEYMEQYMKNIKYKKISQYMKKNRT